MKSIHLSSIVMSLVLSTSWAQEPSPAVYTIDAARSKIEITVFRDGLLKGMGHDHTVAAKSFSGEARFNSVNLKDSSVHLNIESGSLVVLDSNVSEKDRKEIQATMLGAKVLNVNEFPKILFHSAGVSNATKTGEDLTLNGRLNLHGVEREISFPVQIHQENNLLRATGMVAIAQTDFGIKPVKAALGTVRVKDQIKVEFDFLAVRVNP
jgi:polyisoprenoid-binding protein YceI